MNLRLAVLFGMLLLSLRAECASAKRRVIVRDVTGLSAQFNSNDSRILKSRVLKPGMQFIRQMRTRTAVIVEATEAQIAEMESNGLKVEEEGMAYIPTPVHEQMESFSDYDASALAFAQQIPWGISRVGASQVRDSRGEGVKVCVSDTGIDLDHPDLAPHIISNFNAVNPGFPGDDDQSHGTHVAGIIGALDNDIGIVGIAPEVSLIAAKGLGADGSGTYSALVETIDYCRQQGADVINMSWGAESPSPLIHDALIDAANAGIILIAAAGNDKGKPVSYPAAYPQVIAVSSTDMYDQLSPFSNIGSQVLFSAPGSFILSSVKDGGYSYYYGTSMAAPHVAGVAALMLSHSPSSTANGLRGLNIGLESIKTFFMLTIVTLLRTIGVLPRVPFPHMPV